LYWSRVGSFIMKQNVDFKLAVAILIVLEQGWKPRHEARKDARLVAILIVLEQGWKR